MDYHYKYRIILIILYGVVLPVSGYSYTGERSIRTSVLSSFSYDRMARPSDSTTASVGYNLLAVNDVDIENQAFSCTGWFTVHSRNSNIKGGKRTEPYLNNKDGGRLKNLWTDERLMWDPVVYDDTEYIHALEAEIWKPEILISNAQENVGLVSDDHLIYRIKYTGEVEWEPLLSSKVDCRVDATYFPFDNQECSIELTSWGLPDTELNLELLWTNVSMTEFRESETWTVINSNVTLSSVTENVHGVVESFSKVVFTFKMSRKPGNYVFTTLVPIILSSFLMTITNFIPLKTGERVVSGFLVLVNNTILLTIFVQQIPDIATTNALLGIYLIGNLCIDYARMFITVLMAKLHHKSEKYTSVGRGIKLITLIVKWLLCFKNKPVESERIPIPTILNMPTDDLKKISKTAPPKKNVVAPEPNDSYSNFTETMKIKESDLPVLNSRYDVGLPSPKAKKFEVKEENVEEDFHTNDNDASEMTWDSVATVFDRLWFLLFFILKAGFNTTLILHLLYDDPTIVFK